MIILTDRKGKDIENPTITDIQKALNDLYLSKNVKNLKENYVSLMNDSELALEIYQNTIILQDYGRFKYDGPDGPGELLSVRYKEGSVLSVFYRIEEVTNLLENDERKKLMEILKSLAKT